MSLDTEPRPAGPAAGSATSVAGQNRTPSTPATPRLPGRRNPKWIALGVKDLLLPI